MHKHFFSYATVVSSDLIDKLFSFFIHIRYLEEFLKSSPEISQKNYNNCIKLT